jgi:hypothetical protein
MTSKRKPNNSLHATRVERFTRSDKSGTCGDYIIDKDNRRRQRLLLPPCECARNVPLPLGVGLSDLRTCCTLANEPVYQWYAESLSHRFGKQSSLIKPSFTVASWMKRNRDNRPSNLAAY